MKKLVPQSIKNIYHLFQAILANLMYGFPSRKIKIIGVTGTNGKTTTCHMIAKIFEEAGKKVAMATTINFKIIDNEWVNMTKFTTLSSFAVQKFISQAVSAGCEYLILETSSHSLDQNRVWGVKYETAVITNVTREHLDYHKNMERYRQVKLRLFNNINIAVINLDMESPEDFISLKSDKRYGYSIQNHSEHSEESNIEMRFLDKLGMTLVSTEDIEMKMDGSSFKLQDASFKLNLPGLFNVENALAAVCVGLAESISLDVCSKALEKIENIPGRMEYVSNDKGLNIIVDYAVTPDSLEKLYKLISAIRSGSLKTATNSRIISVFGSCGERDRGKRPMMGEIVSRNADFVIITNEDPYNEDPWQIINEVAKGIPICHSDPPVGGEESGGLNSGIPRQARDDIFCFTENVNFWKIMDRREAIQKALKLAQPGDYIIVTGKGAEEAMALGENRISWNDKRVILEELNEHS